MTDFSRAAWRFIKTFVVVFAMGALNCLVLYPVDKWLDKVVVVSALSAGILALAKYIRDRYGVDLKIV